MPELKEGCIQPVRGPIVPATETATAPAPRQAKPMLAMVGKPAPDFEATAFVAGVGFKPVRLSDYKGKWIVVCFDPGPFTFV